MPACGGTGHASLPSIIRVALGTRVIAGQKRRYLPPMTRDHETDIDYEGKSPVSPVRFAVFAGAGPRMTRNHERSGKGLGCARRARPFALRREAIAHPQFAPSLADVLKHSTGPLTVSLIVSGKMPVSLPLTVSVTVFVPWSYSIRDTETSLSTLVSRPW